MTGFGLLLLSLLAPAVAEKTWLSKFANFPDARTLEVVHFITADVHAKPEISLNGPVSVSRAASVSESSGLELSVIPHASLQKLSESGGGSFCCTSEMIDKKQCQVKDTLSIPGAYSFGITTKSLNEGFGNKLFQLPDTGLYYITLSNCGSKDAAGVKFTSGELVLVNRSGYLPGEEAPKLSFYFYLCLGYVGVLGLWAVWCGRWSDVLFKIHHYITTAIFVGLLEAASWYASLYHWNYLGHRWWSMMVLASGGTVVKQGVCFGLLLLASMGLGVTKPRLESKQVVQVFLLVLGFIICDGVRSMAVLLQDKVSGEASTLKILLLVVPGSFFTSILFSWTFQALQNTIEELRNAGQSVKLEVYTQLRFVLGLMATLILILIGYETIIVKNEEVALNWKNRYIFSDVLSHMLFFILLLTIMILWRPSERSTQMAYSQQLVGGDAEKVGGGMGEDGGVEDSGIEMTGGTGPEKDFQSVDVELGDDDDKDDFDFNASMREAKGKPVLE